METRKRFNLKTNPNFDARTFCEINNIQEKEAVKGVDLRNPEYRRDFFLKFYEFHLTYKSHPGCVYYLFPELANYYSMTQEQKLWFAFINGCTQNPCTTSVIFEKFPYLHKIKIQKLEDWHAKNWKSLDYDTDKRYSKGHFVENVENYLHNLQGENQQNFFDKIGNSSKAEENFLPIWNKVMKDFFLFGRLGTFSYLEYLNIMGVNIQCNDLFYDDLSGSKSHRNGTLKVLGRDDLDWVGKKPEIEHTKELVEWVEEEAFILLQQAKAKFKGKEFYKDVNYFTLESTFCTFKSFFRENRRYPNVYNDMLYNRIKKAESFLWHKQGIFFEKFWDIRKKVLPKQLRLEDNPNDPGLSKLKQNFFRETGQSVMIGNLFPQLLSLLDKQFKN